MLALAAQGVDTSLVNWWDEVALQTEMSRRTPTDAVLPAPGLVVHYDPEDFMGWTNNRTWHSEWPKYRATDPAGVPPRPRSRRA